MSLENLSKDLLKIAKQLGDKNQSKKFMKSAANKLRKKTLAVAERKVKKKTGNYLKSIKAGKAYEFEGNISARTYSKAPHAHLIEYGHVTKDKGFKRGYHVFEEAAANFEEEFNKDLEKFVDNILKENDV